MSFQFFSGPIALSGFFPPKAGTTGIYKDDSTIVRVAADTPPGWGMRVARVAFVRLDPGMALADDS